jgi:hypothetical protein
VNKIVEEDLVPDRRSLDAEFRGHIQEHLDRLDREMMEIRAQQTTIAQQLAANTAAVTQLTDLLNASRLGTSVIKYLITIGTGLIVAYAAYKGIKN